MYQNGAKSVIIGDSSTIYANTKKVMKKLNIFELEKLDPPVWIYNFDRNKWVKKENS